MLEEISGEVFFSFRYIDEAFIPNKIPIESITLRLRLPFCLVLQRINGLVGLCSFDFSKREENNHEMGSEVGNNIWYPKFSCRELGNGYTRYGRKTYFAFTIGVSRSITRPSVLLSRVLSSTSFLLLTTERIFRCV